MACSQPAASQAKAVHLFINSSFIVLLLFFYLTAPLTPSIPTFLQQFQKNTKTNSSLSPNGSFNGCNGLHRLESYGAKCRYLTSGADCNPEGYINYLRVFYCVCGRHPVLGYAMLILWLILLFYLLGNTSATYFCSNLEGLSRLLNLPPALAGATLLSLGNGAPDVFSAIVSFGTSRGDVGLNGVLGGAFFVSSVVVGTISICVGHRDISIDKRSFIRDICFLIIVLLVLILILIIGEIRIWGAMSFTSLYAVYALLVSFPHFYHGDRDIDDFSESCSALSKCKSFEASEHEEMGAPLLVSVEIDEPISGERVNLSINDEPKLTKECFSSFWSWLSRLLFFLELPLYLPRRLTIPDVCKKRWSKPFAVSSVVLAPILLAALWNSKMEEMGSEESLKICLFGGLAGVVLGTVASLKTKKGSPPTRFLFFWLAGGFLMSVVWTYIIAEELLSLLVSLGAILRISSSVLGLTVLAWGNSIGDLIANLAVALNGGSSGTQVAVSGCYGGPIFNTLVGVGLSLVFSSWGGYPSPLPMSKDPTLFQTLGFLIAGLLWTLLILPNRGMKPDRVLGCGLLCIYLCFLLVSFGH